MSPSHASVFARLTGFRRGTHTSTVRRLVYVIVACAAVAAVVTAATGTRALRLVLKSREAGVSAPPAPTPAVAEQPRGERIETESVTLTPDGFAPSGITRPRGRFFLSVTNRSGLDDLDLRLAAESGQGGAFHTSARRHSWWGEVNPPPGRYVLTEARHPNWRCVVTIAER